MGLSKRGPTPLQELEVKKNPVDLFDDKTTVAHWGHLTSFSLVVNQLKFSCYSTQISCYSTQYYCY